MFYDAIVAVRDRLQNSNEVYNPTDPELSLLTAQNHYDKVDNWHTRLNTQIENLSVLLDDKCTRKEAIDAWAGFFNHTYWTELSEATAVYECASFSKSVYTDNEEFIEDYVQINDCYELNVNCRVEANGIRKQAMDRFLETFPQFRNLIPHGLHLYFEAETNVPKPYNVWWKVRNVGTRAENKNQIRGQIEKQWGLIKKENSEFYGPHYVECYIIKEDECVAMKRISVPIGEQSI